MKLTKILSIGLFSMLLSASFGYNEKVKSVAADELPYEIVDYIDSTGVELIDTQIKHGTYPRLTYDFMLLQDSSAFIAGSATHRFYVEDDQFKLSDGVNTLGANGFAPFIRYKAITGRQENWSEDHLCMYLDMQPSSLSFEHCAYSVNPGNSNNITLFGGYYNYQTIYTKLRLFEVTLNGKVLKPCHIIETDEYCLVDPTTGDYYKDVNKKSFVKDSLATDVTYINEEGKEAVALSANKIRPNKGYAKASGDIYVDEDLEIQTLELQGDTNLYIFDDAKLTITESIIEKDNTSKYKLNIFGQENQTGSLIVKGKDGFSTSGGPSGRAGDGKPAATIKSLNIYGCNSSFSGGNGGNNGSSHTGHAGYSVSLFESGDGVVSVKCDEINIVGGVVTFEGGKGGVTSDTYILSENPGLNGVPSTALSKEISVKTDRFCLSGGLDSESAVTLDASGKSYINDVNFMFVKVDTLTNECPYDAVIVEKEIRYPFIKFDDCVQVFKTYSDSFVCRLMKDVEIDYELALVSNETLDLGGNTFTCKGLYLINNSDLVSYGETIGKVVTDNFHWTNDGYGLFKSVLGFDGIYYIISSNFAVVNSVTSSWVNDVCTLTVSHVGLSDVAVLNQTGVFVKDTDATCEENEKGHYEAIFENIGKQVTETNSVEKENTALGHHFSGEASYVWDGNKCTATHHCDREGCEYSESETATGDYVKDTAATCEENEKGHFVATFKNSYFEKQSSPANSKEMVLTALGHHYSGEASYVWDGNKCTATLHCDREGCQHVESETVIGVYVKDTDATYNVDEKGHYEATFEAPFVNQTTAANSVVIEGSALTTDPNNKDDNKNEEENEKGCLGFVSVCSIFFFVVPVLGICLVKKEIK